MSLDVKSFGRAETRVAAPTPAPVADGRLTRRSHEAVPSHRAPRPSPRRPMAEAAAEIEQREGTSTEFERAPSSLKK